MAKADREAAVIYTVWCPAAGQTEQQGFSELGAIDAANAARIHVERMSERAWEVAIVDPDDICVTCGHKRRGHKYRHLFRSKRPGESVVVLVRTPGEDRPDVFTVRRVMKPAYEVVP